MIRVRTTRSQREHAEWAIGAMQDMAGDPDWYAESDLPRMEGDDLVFPTLAAVSDMLYRLEEELPDVIHGDPSVSGAAAQIASAQRLADKIREAGGAPLAAILKKEQVDDGWVREKVVNRCYPDTGAATYREWYEQSSDELLDYASGGLGGLQAETDALNLTPGMFRWRFCELRVSELLRIMPASTWRIWYENERRMRRDDYGEDDNYFDGLEQEWGGGYVGPIVVVYLNDGSIDIGDGWHRSAIAVTHGWETVPAVVGQLGGLVRNVRSSVP